MKAVCSKCGSDDSLYREVEIHSTGYRDLVVTYEDGKLKAREGSTERDGGFGDEDAGGYACGACDATAFKLEDLVTPENMLTPGAGCACGHGFSDHHPNRQWDKKLHTRPLRPCAHCHCRDYETDAALASVAA